MSISFEVFNKISEEERKGWHLYVDATYKADSTKKNLSSEVLSKLLGVKNQGGFRYLGPTDNPRLVVLFSSGEDVYWRDELDNSLGVFLYYGDNKTPGNDLHNTKLHGNEILRGVFARASSDNYEVRSKIPPILVFKKVAGRDVKFLGLAVPGIYGKPKKDWLTAVWGCDRNGERFQNYKAFFTILNTASGCDVEKNSGINLAWLTDINEDKAYESVYAPKEWRRYVDNKTYSPLIARVEKFSKNKEEQLPADVLKIKMLQELQEYFISKDRGYSFEKFAAYIVEGMDEAVVDIEVTRPFKDGGFDAVGYYKIFKNAENSVFVEFYLQAKCYSINYAVGVSDTSRLISRLKKRQFGILVTTSYIGKQAYQEIIDDGHPVVIINGKNIIDYIFNELEIRTSKQLKEWLSNKFS